MEQNWRMEGGRRGGMEGGRRRTCVDKTVQTSNKDSAVWVKPWGRTANRVGVRESPRNDLDFLIPHTATRDLEVVLSSIHWVVSAVEKERLDGLL